MLLDWSRRMTLFVFKVYKLNGPVAVLSGYYEHTLFACFRHVWNFSRSVTFYIYDLGHVLWYERLLSSEHRRGRREGKWLVYECQRDNRHGWAFARLDRFADKYRPLGR